MCYTTIKTYLINFCITCAVAASMASCATPSALPPQSSNVVQTYHQVETQGTHQPLWTIEERFSEFLKDFVSLEDQRSMLYFVGSYQSAHSQKTEFCLNMATLNAETKLAVAINNLSEALILDAIDEHRDFHTAMLRAHGEVVAAPPPKPSIPLEVVERFWHLTLQNQSRGRQSECFVLTRVSKHRVRQAVSQRIQELNSLPDQLKTLLLTQQPTTS